MHVHSMSRQTETMAPPIARKYETHAKKIKNENKMPHPGDTGTSKAVGLYRGSPVGAGDKDHLPSYVFTSLLQTSGSFCEQKYRIVSLAWGTAMLVWI